MTGMLDLPPLPPRLRIRAEGGDIPLLGALGVSWEEIEPDLDPASLTGDILKRITARCAEGGAGVSLALPLESILRLDGLAAWPVERLLLSVPPGLEEGIAARLLARWRAALAAREILLQLSGRAADLEGIPGIFRAAAGSGVKRIRIEPLPPLGEARDRLARSAAELGLALDGFPCLVEPNLRKRSGPARYLSPRLGPKDLVSEITLVPESEPRRECLFPWDWTFVGARGKVFPCPVSSEPLGDISSASLEEIWQGDRYREFRRRLLSTAPPTCCRRCRIRPLTYPHRRTAWAWSGSNDRFGVTLGTGWYPAEETGFRWSREEGMLLLRGSGQSRLVLVLTRAGGSIGSRGTVLIDGNVVGRWRLRWPGDRKLVYDIPSTGDPAVIVLRPDRTVRPADSGEGFDRRHLGVAWKGAALLE